MSLPNIYTVGGTVQAGGGIYIPRQADEELMALCRDSVFAYVLTPRQMGKSSLMVRTAERLADESIISVVIDLTQLGVKLTAEQWYLGLLAIIEESLELDTDVVEWWEERTHLGFTQRLTQFFEQVLLVEVSSPVVVFVDEIDTTLSLDFTDDFFAAIRYLYVARANNPELQRLSVVLIGVATPGDLIRDAKRTPFNIGQRVDLTDFTWEEAKPFAEGLGLPREEGEQVLRWVLHWTGGHPYLTQRLCSAIWQQGKSNWSKTDVDRVVSSTFFGSMSEQDNNLQFVRDMLTKRAPDGEVLTTYRQIRLGKRAVVDEEQSIIKSHLKLSGVVRREDKFLRLRNRIYGYVFDRRWINEHLPFSLRDRWEQLKPAIPYVVGLSVIAASMGGLALYAVGQSRIAEQRLEEVKRLKIAAEEEKKKAIAVAEQAQELQKKAENALKAEAIQKLIAQKKEQEAKLAQKGEIRERQVAEQRGVELATALQKTKAAQQAETKQRQLAEQRKRKAEKARKLAEEKQAEAEKQKKQAIQAKAEAEKRRINAEILAQTLTSEKLLASNLELEALVAGIKAGKQVKKHDKNVQGDNRIKTAANLLNMLYGGIKERNRLESHSRGISSIRFTPTVAFSPDGKTIATASSDSIAKLWNLQGQQLQIFKGYSVFFSPDRKTIASVRYDTVQLWNLQGQELQSLEVHSSSVNSVAFSSDGKTIATASSDGTVKLWNLQGQDLQTLKGHSGEINSVAFSPDGKTIATASSDGTVKLWNLQGQELQTLKDPGNELYSVAFSPDGKTIATASYDKTVKLWNLAGQELATLKGHSSTVWSVAFSPDGKTIASASSDSTVKLWNLEGQELATLKGHRGVVKSVAFSPDGKTIASASSDGTVKLWNLMGQKLQTLPSERYMKKGHSNEVTSFAFSPDGKTLVSASSDGTVKLWNLAGQELQTLKGHSSSVNSVAFSPDGKTIASVGYDTVYLLNLEGQELQNLKGHSSRVNSIAFSPDSKTIASASLDKTVKLWNLAGQELQTLKGHSDEVTSVAFSPDGKTIASTSSDNTLKLWNLGGQELQTLKGHSDEVNSVAFSPDGKTIASTSSDGTLKLWNLAGRELQTLRVRDRDSHFVTSVAFSPDGKAIATAISDGTLKLWNLDLDDLLVRGCNWARDYLNNNPNVKKEDKELCRGI